MKETFSKIFGNIAGAFKTYPWLKFVCAGVAAVAVAVPIIVVCLSSGGDDSKKEKDREEEKVEELTDEALIEQKIEVFMTAYNSGDMDAAMECLDAKSKNALQAQIDLFNALFGGLTGFSIDLRDLFALGVAIEKDDYLSIKVKDVKVSGKEAVATTELRMKSENSQTMYFVMIYENDGWYINDMLETKPCAHDYAGGVCSKCGYVDPNFKCDHVYVNGKCNECGAVDPNHTHTYDNGVCSVCGALDPNDVHNHEYKNGWCDCGEYDPSNHPHRYVDGYCKCGVADPTHVHNYVDCKCAECGTVEPYPDKTTVSQGLNFELNNSADGYRLKNKGNCNDDHVVIPEYPSDVNPDIPVTTVSLSGISAKYVTIPASVKKFENWGNSSIKAINYLGTLEDWLKIEFAGNPLGDAILYLNGEAVVGELVIPSSISVVPKNAFCEYAHITSVKVSAETIGEQAFHQCGNLANVEVGTGTKYISDKAFSGNPKLTTVVISDTVKSIGYQVFKQCSSLNSIILGDYIESMEYGIFYQSAYYDNAANWEKGVLYVDGYLVDIKNDVINLTVKDGVIGIANNAVDYHPHLTSVVLPSSLKYIGRQAFYSCGKLQLITATPNLEVISDDAFGYCRQLFVKGFKLSDVETIGEYNSNIQDAIFIDSETGLPEGTFEYNGHNYLLFINSGISNWNDAKKFCESLGGHLATITTSAENEVLYQLMIDSGVDEAYFGLEDADLDGNWEWVTGESVNYTNWADGEPSGGYEYYGQFYYYVGASKWNDADGDSWGSIAFICEWDY